MSELRSIEDLVVDNLQYKKFEFWGREGLRTFINIETAIKDALDTLFSKGEAYAQRDEYRISMPQFLIDNFLLPPHLSAGSNLIFMGVPVIGSYDNFITIFHIDNWRIGDDKMVIRIQLN